MVIEQEKKIDTLFYQSPIGKELFDKDGTLIDVNAACFDIFGVVDKNELRNFNFFKDPNLTEIEKRQLLAFETVRAEREFNFEKVCGENLYQTTRSGTIYLDILISPICKGWKQSVYRVSRSCSGYHAPETDPRITCPAQQKTQSCRQCYPSRCPQPADRRSWIHGNSRHDDRRSETQNLS